MAERGRHILAQYDNETIIIYQAYRPEIGHFATRHGYFGGDYKYTRMSWIKPNFLRMMYRSDWGRSKGQEVILRIRLRRTYFDLLLRQAVFSSFEASGFTDHGAWKTAVDRSDVRLQWDPDHLPTGDKCERRAVQLGLRAEALEAYGRREAIEIIDMSDFVTEQTAKLSNWRTGTLMTPTEQVYVPVDSDIAEHIGLEAG